MALKCFLPGKALNLANFLIANCNSVVVFIKNINIPTTDEYWNPYVASRDLTANKSCDLSLILATNSLGSWGGVFFLFFLANFVNG